MKRLRLLLLLLLLLSIFTGCSKIAENPVFHLGADRIEEFTADRVVVETVLEDGRISPSRIISDPTEVQEIVSLFSGLTVRSTGRPMGTENRILISFYCDEDLVRSIHYAGELGATSGIGNFLLPDGFDHESVRNLPNFLSLRADFLSLKDEFTGSFPESARFSAEFTYRGMTCDLTASKDENPVRDGYESRKYLGIPYDYREEAIFADFEGGGYAEYCEVSVMVKRGEYFYTLTAYPTDAETKISYADLASVLKEVPELISYEYKVILNDGDMHLSMSLTDVTNEFPKMYLPFWKVSEEKHNGVTCIRAVSDGQQSLLVNTSDGILFVVCTDRKNIGSGVFEDFDFSILQKIADVCGLTFEPFPEDYLPN